MLGIPWYGPYTGSEFIIFKEVSTKKGIYNERDYSRYVIPDNILDDNFCQFFIWMAYAGNNAEKVSVQNKKDILENKISDIAERYVGIPYGFGKDLEKYRALDNSHLLCLIYHEAAKQAGLRFKGYMPIKSLLRNTVEVRRDELKNGDLIGC